MLSILTNRNVFKVVLNSDIDELIRNSDGSLFHIFGVQQSVNQQPASLLLRPGSTNRRVSCMECKEREKWIVFHSNDIQCSEYHCHNLEYQPLPHGQLVWMR